MAETGTVATLACWSSERQIGQLGGETQPAEARSARHSIVPLGLVLMKQKREVYSSALGMRAALRGRLRSCRATASQVAEPVEQAPRGQADDRDGHLARDVGKSLQELGEPIVNFEMVKERLDGDPRPHEARLAVHATGIDRDVGCQRAVGRDELPLLPGGWRVGRGVDCGHGCLGLRGLVRI